jgi:hypothetical protein
LAKLKTADSGRAALFAGAAATAALFAGAGAAAGRSRGAAGGGLAGAGAGVGGPAVCANSRDASTNEAITADRRMQGHMHAPALSWSLYRKQSIADRMARSVPAGTGPVF